MAIASGRAAKAGRPSGRMGRAAQRLPPGDGEITGAVVILGGTEDRIVNFATPSEQLSQAIPGSRLRLFPCVGHMLHHFAADEVAQATELMADNLPAMS